jgi:hypothetical protein
VQRASAGPSASPAARPDSRRLGGKITVPRTAAVHSSTTRSHETSDPSARARCSEASICQVWCGVVARAVDGCRGRRGGGAAGPAPARPGGTSGGAWWRWASGPRGPVAPARRGSGRPPRSGGRGGGPARRHGAHRRRRAAKGQGHDSRGGWRRSPARGTADTGGGPCARASETRPRGSPWIHPGGIARRASAVRGQESVLAQEGPPCGMTSVTTTHPLDHADPLAAKPRTPTTPAKLTGS